MPTQLINQQTCVSFWAKDDVAALREAADWLDLNDVGEVLEIVGGLRVAAEEPHETGYELTLYFDDGGEFAQGKEATDADNK
jgi:hypothetical protein